MSHAIMNKRQQKMNGWSQTVSVDGREFYVGVTRGRYRGRFYGNRSFFWDGFVYENAKRIWSGGVDKNISAKRLVDNGRTNP